MSKRPPLVLTAAVHPIQVVTRRTGLSADLIRVWEKRYGVVMPARTPSGRRLYSDGDIEWLRLLAEATLTGRTIGQVATLSADALAALVHAGSNTSHEPAGRADHGVPTPPAPTADHLGMSLLAVEQFDGVALDARLRRAIVALSAEAFLDALAVPLPARVAERVREGSLRPAHLHLTFAVLRRVLDHVTTMAASPDAFPHLLVTTLPGQPEELGALVTAAAAAVAGWQVTYMGPGLPAEDVAETAASVGARAVALSLGAPSGDRVVSGEFRRLRALLPPAVEILVSGAGPGAPRGVLREIGASVLPDLRALRARLRALQDASTRPAGRPI
jgi:MerR family transcriptional regulator, light-induced transcriptional regulator